MNYLLNEYLFGGDLLVSCAFLVWPSIVLLGILTWYRRNQLTLPIIVWSGLGGFLEYVSTNQLILNDFFHATNAPLYHVGAPLFAICLISIYYGKLRLRIPEHLLLIVMSMIVTASVINAIWGSGMYASPSLAMGLYALLGVLLPLWYLFYLLQSLTVERLENDPLFITSAGFLIYFSGNLLLWIFSSFLSVDYETFWPVYRINHVLTILLGFLLFITLLIRPQANEKNKYSRSDLSR